MSDEGEISWEEFKALPVGALLYDRRFPVYKYVVVRSFTAENISVLLLACSDIMEVHKQLNRHYNSQPIIRIHPYQSRFGRRPFSWKYEYNAYRFLKRIA